MSTQDKIAKARQMVSDLCEGNVKWTIRVPAEPDRDPDLVIAAGLQSAKERIEQLEREKAELEQKIRNMEYARQMRDDHRSELMSQNVELAKEALNNVLWLERRLPKGYGEVPHIKRFIAKLERVSGATATEGGEG